MAVRHTFDKMASQLAGDIPTLGGAIPTLKRGLKNDDQTTDKDGGSQSGERDDGYDSEATEPAPKRPSAIKKQRLENKKAQKNATARPTLAKHYRPDGEPTDDPMHARVGLMKPVGEVFPGLNKHQWMQMPRAAKLASQRMRERYDIFAAEYRREIEVYREAEKRLSEYLKQHEKEEEWEEASLKQVLSECVEMRKLATSRAYLACSLYDFEERAYFKSGGVAFKTTL